MRFMRKLSLGGLGAVTWFVAMAWSATAASPQFADHLSGALLANGSAVNLSTMGGDHDGFVLRVPSRDVQLWRVPGRRYRAAQRRCPGRHDVGQVHGLLDRRRDMHVRRRCSGGAGGPGLPWVPDAAGMGGGIVVNGTGAAPSVYFGTRHMERLGHHCATGIHGRFGHPDRHRIVIPRCGERAANDRRIGLKRQ